MKNTKDRFPLDPKVNWWRLPEEVEEISKTVATIGTRQGPPGIQGVPGLQGQQGVPGLQGTVGPAGLNWQGVWDTDTAYAEDDAVGFNGASWFCIAAVTGTGNSNPETDTASWSLLASQGAPGIQGIQGVPGIQGEAGTIPVKTRGQLNGSTTTYQTQTLLSFDINLISDGTVSSFFKLPDTLVPGKEVIIDVMGNNCWIYGFNGGLAFETAVNGSGSQIITKFNDLIKFTSTGANFWIVEYLLRTPVPTPLVTSQQVSATVSGTNFSGLKYVRLYASSVGRSVKWNEIVNVGMDLFVKNTSLYPIQFSVYNLNLGDTSDGYIYINPGEYYYFVKEDSSTNMVTPFKLTNGTARVFSVNTSITTAPTLSYMIAQYSSLFSYPIGCKIQFSAITTGPLVYTKTSSNTWTTETVTILV